LRFSAFLIVFFTAALLILATLDMPDWGDPSSPASSHVSPVYIEKAFRETATPNLVTAVLADYRSYDTLGETTVIFTAGVVCMMLLRRQR
jgi:multicomponent Na+:H+ antiporter subunit B